MKMIWPFLRAHLPILIIQAIILVEFGWILYMARSALLLSPKRAVQVQTQLKSFSWEKSSHMKDTVWPCNLKLDIMHGQMRASCWCEGHTAVAGQCCTLSSTSWFPAQPSGLSTLGLKNFLNQLFPSFLKSIGHLWSYTSQEKSFDFKVVIFLLKL